MSRDYEAQGVYKPAAIGHRPPRDLPHRRYQAAPGQHEHEHSERNFDDVASVLGVPAAEVTPAVQAAIAGLVAEIDHLRAELDHLQHRAARLEEQADAEPLLPLLNRHAFTRELGRLALHAAQSQVPLSLVVLHLGSLEAVRLARGLAAADAVALRVATTLAGALRQGDVPGALGGGDFALLLPVADGAAAEEKAAELARRVQAECRESGVPLGLAWGGHEVRPGEEPESALANAFEAMRRRLAEVRR